MSKVAPHPRDDFNRLYRDISQSVAAAADDIANLRVNHQDGRKEIGGILEKLRAIQNQFDGELNLLEQHAEWDKFTLAFFGETNAGKSTIIDSLRILFNEESRKALLDQNGNDIVQFERELNAHIQSVQQALRSVYEAYAKDLLDIRQHVESIKAITTDELITRARRQRWLAGIVGVAIGVVLTALPFLLYRWGG